MIPNPSHESLVQISNGNFPTNVEVLVANWNLISGKRVLEIGCGNGPIGTWLTSQGINYMGFDYDPFEAQHAIERFPELTGRIFNGDGAMLPFADNSFDTVLSFDVFEHIPYTNRHLQEVRRVLSPGGVYILGTPNKLTNIPFEMLKARKLWHARPDHCSLHTLPQLERRLRENGFEFDLNNPTLVTEWFKKKLLKFAGKMGPLMVRIADSPIGPDHWPNQLKTNFYGIARPI